MLESITLSMHFKFVDEAGMQAGMLLLHNFTLLYVCVYTVVIFL